MKKIYLRQSVTLFLLLPQLYRCGSDFWQSITAPVSVKLPVQQISVVTEDRDGNGKLDHLKLSFPSALNDDLTGLKLAVPGWQVLSVSTGSSANDNELEVTLQETPGDCTFTSPGFCETGLRPELTIQAAGNLLARNGSGIKSLTALAADGAPALLLGAHTIDENHNGFLDGLTLLFSETVSPAGAEPGHATVAGRNITTVKAATPHRLLPPASVDHGITILFQEGVQPDTGLMPAFSGSEFLKDPSGNVTESTGVTPQDGAGPVLMSAETRDADSNGRIDQARLQFSESVDDNSILFNLSSITVTGYTNSGISFANDPANDANVNLAFAESPLPDTGNTPVLEVHPVDETQSFADLAGNRAFFTTSVTAVDKAPPILVAYNFSEGTEDYAKMDNDDFLNIQFSEQIQTIGITPSSLFTFDFRSVRLIFHSQNYPNDQIQLAFNERSTFLYANFSAALLSNLRDQAGNSNLPATLSNANPNTLGLPSTLGRVSSTRYTSLSAGEYHRCGLKNNGDLLCWGHNGSMQNGTTNYQGNPTLVASLVKKVVTGMRFTCFQKFTDDSVNCFGANSEFQLGLNHSNNTAYNGSSANRPVAATDQTGSTLLDSVTEIYAGPFHTCTIRQSLSGACWGANGSGEAGTGTVARNQVGPAPISNANSTFLKEGTFFLGMQRSCLVGSDGSGLCWGVGSPFLSRTANSNQPISLSQTGLREILLDPWGGADFNNPTQIPNYICMFTGSRFTCDDSRFQLPGGLAPADIISFARGQLHLCALLNNRQVRCWGDNSLGQLGNDGNAGSPVLLDTIGDPLSDVISVAAGRNYTYAVRRNGQVYFWGNADTSNGNLDTSDAATATHSGPGKTYPAAKRIL